MASGFVFYEKSAIIEAERFLVFENKNMRQRIFALSLFMLLFIMCAAGAQAVVNCPAGSIPRSGVCFPATTGLSQTPIFLLIMTVMNWLLAIFGMIAIIAFVISGLQYLLSAGDEDAAETAKRNLKYSIIGVIVGLSGWIIINAISNALSGWVWFI